jgi:excisionase family DNA binding protein
MEKEIKPNQVYTPKEARDFLKVSESTMKRMIKNGAIKAYKVSGQYRIWGKEILLLVSPELGIGARDFFQKIKAKTKRVIEKW